MKNTLKNLLFGAVIMPTILASTINPNPASISANKPLDTNPIQNILGEIKENKDTAIDAERQAKAEKINTYFGNKNLPLEGHGMEMVMVAEKYNIDWRLIPSIAFIETTGGKFACPKTYKVTGDIRYTYNVFGWGSCSIKFESYNEAFEILGKNLSGNNPKTARHYKGKDTVGILESYNPRHVVSDYPEKIMRIMTSIDNTKTGSELAMK